MSEGCERTPNNGGLDEPTRPLFSQAGLEDPTWVCTLSTPSRLSSLERITSSKPAQVHTRSSIADTCNNDRLVLFEILKSEVLT